MRFIHVSGANNARADALSRRYDHDVGNEERQRIRSDIAKQQFADVFGQLGLSNARINTLIAEVSAGDEEIAAAIEAGYANDPRCSEILRDAPRYGYRLRWDLSNESMTDPFLYQTIAPYERESCDACTMHRPPVTLGSTRPTHDWPRTIIGPINGSMWLNTAGAVTCQQSKARSGKVPGLTQPIEVQPKAHTIALDFLGPLHRTARGKDCILVIVDAFTRRAYLEPITSTTTAEQVAQVVFNRVVRHQGLPRAIRSDRDSRFTGQLWQSLWQLLGTDLDSQRRSITNPMA